jgi:hypothetical protein
MTCIQSEEITLKNSFLQTNIQSDVDEYTKAPIMNMYNSCPPSQVSHWKGIWIREQMAIAVISRCRQTTNINNKFEFIFERFYLYINLRIYTKGDIGVTWWWKRNYR